MKCKSIITIGRQFGSGGREVGEKLAAELGIKCYDSELLDRAAKDSGICQELLENHDERPTSSFLYSLVMDTYSMGYSSPAFSDMPLNHKVFLAQFNAIKEIAKEGPCIMVGRCADYALADLPNLVSVFIHASMDKRIQRIARIYDLSNAKAKDRINKKDKSRASYYNYYTNKKWGDPDSYQLSVDTGVLGTEGAMKVILEYIPHQGRAWLQKGGFMKLVIQRVSSASVAVDGETIGKIGKGCLVLIGVGASDNEAVADKFVRKLLGLRIFEDENGKTNLSLADVNGQLLLVSQFTLYANCRKRKPSQLHRGRRSG